MNYRMIYCNDLESAISKNSKNEIDIKKILNNTELSVDYASSFKTGNNKIDVANKCNVTCSYKIKRVSWKMYISPVSIKDIKLGNDNKLIDFQNIQLYNYMYLRSQRFFMSLFWNSSDLMTYRKKIDVKNITIKINIF